VRRWRNSGETQEPGPLERSAMLYMENMIAMKARKNKTPTLTDETARLEKEIGGHIDAAVKADPRTGADIASLIGITLDALNRIRQGKSTVQYAKLVRMAEILHLSPNQLLGFDGEREVIKGALEGVFEGLGYPQLEGSVVIVLKVIDTHESGDRPHDPHERARLIAKFLIQQSGLGK
jgi:transcriptional regulator with XRE-family HTH domain